MARQARALHQIEAMIALSVGEGHRAADAFSLRKAYG